MKCSTAGVYVYPPCLHRRSDINDRQAKYTQKPDRQKGRHARIAEA